MFKKYLKELWKDLSQRCENGEGNKGINKIVFLSFYKLPGIIGNRLFSLLDPENTGFINAENFININLILFCEDFEINLKLIFDIYDFDKDGKISSVDIRAILSYISLMEENSNYKLRVKSQEEIEQILEVCFNDRKKLVDNKYLNIDIFKNIVQNKNSDVYLMLLLFLYSKSPFSKKSLECYVKQNNPLSAKKSSGCLDNSNSNDYESNANSNLNNSNNNSNFFFLSKRRSTNLVATHSTINTFSPYFLLSNHKKNDDFKLNFLGPKDSEGKKNSSKNNNLLSLNYQHGKQNKFQKTSEGSRKEDDPSDFFLCNAKSTLIRDHKIFGKKSDLKDNLITTSKDGSKKKGEYQEDNDNFICTGNKNKNKKKNLNSEEEKPKIYHDIEPPKGDNYDDIKEEFQYIFNSLDEEKQNNVIKEEENEDDEHNKDKEGLDLNDDNKFGYDMKKNFNNNKKIDEGDTFSSQSSEADEIYQEGLLYKLLEGKMKSLWFKLVHKDLYFFKNKNEPCHKGFHNLSGLFFQEEPQYTYKDKIFYSFSIMSPNKVRTYYIDDLEEYKLWVKNIKIAIEYVELTDLYEIQKQIGKGKYGVVKLGTDKKDKKSVAIKIVSKKKLNKRDLELIQSEIESLKICDHPNIIKLYKVIENMEYYYIVMEYCNGGNLAEFFSRNNYALPEQVVCNIIHKLLAALYYLDTYGIIHRDLKLENILVTIKDNNFDIKISDFGLSKIIGPEEKCKEMCGSLLYVAPEILSAKSYNKAADMWSIGIICYCLLSGYFPFDCKDTSSGLARQIVFSQIDFSFFKGESKDFVMKLLNKDEKQRMNIKSALEHDWISKFGGKKVIAKKKVNTNNSNSLISSNFEFYTTT